MNNNRLLWKKVIGVEYNSELRFSYYIVFEVNGVERRTLITQKTLDYHKIPSIEKGDEVKVFKSINNGKEFYMVGEVRKAHGKQKETRN